MSRRSAFQVRFWGVRGSIPTPGPQTREVGGNTSCVEVRVGDETIILDAGSGVRGLGEKLHSEKISRATFLFSHVHWDHILGFPYFRPAAREGNELVLFGERKAGAGIDEILEFQATQTHAPIVMPGKGARVLYEEIKPGDSFQVGEAKITTARMNHPDGCVAYRIEHEGKAVVYATDTEHFAEGLDKELTRLSQGADALIYDAMYTPEEYRGEIGGSKKGWGHSTWRDGLAVARDAGVERFVLFHHDPSHDDRFVLRLEKEAKAEYAGSIVAREQMVMDFEAGKVRLPRETGEESVRVSAKKVSRVRGRAARIQPRRRARG